MSPKIVDKEAKKLEIMQAAIQAFSQNGVANTKMIDIAKAASIGKGTIYEYFSSKEEIFASGFTYFFDGFEREMKQALSKSEDPAEQLEILIRRSLSAFFEDQLKFAAIMLDFWAEGIRNKDDAINNVINLKQLYQGYRAMVVQIIENGMRRGVFRQLDPVPYASFLIGAIDGLMLQWVMEPELFDVQQVGDALCEGMLRGIGK